MAASLLPVPIMDSLEGLIRTLQAISPLTQRAIATGQLFHPQCQLEADAAGSGGPPPDDMVPVVAAQLPLSLVDQAEEHIGGKRGSWCQGPSSHRKGFLKRFPRPEQSARIDTTRR